MKPVTDEVGRWKLMGMGALGVIGIGALAAGVTFAEAIPPDRPDRGRRVIGGNILGVWQRWARPPNCLISLDLALLSDFSVSMRGDRH